MANASSAIFEPPFVTVDGVINIRTIGGYPTTQEGVIVKPGIIYRSGEVNRITDLGKKQLLDLGIKAVFDFRSEREIAMFNAASPDVEGVTFVRPPAIHSAESFNPENVVAMLKRYEENELETFIEEYTMVLRKAGPTFKPVFEHLRDNLDQPCLFHCTAGKDRTGLLAAIILMLLGAKDEDIAVDYALTTKGLEPVAEQMAERYQKMEIFQNNWSAFLKMGNSRKETMEAMVGAIRKTFGGAERYLKEVVGLTDADIGQIRENLLVKSN